MKRWNPTQVVDGDKVEDNMVELSQYYKAVKYPLNTYLFDYQDGSWQDLDNSIHLSQPVMGKIIA